MTFTIGADPEIFLKKNGRPISVYETKLPGSKAEPHKTGYGAVQQDGFAAEFNIDPSPYRDFERFNQNIVRTVADLRTLAGDFSLAKDVTVQDFDKEYISTMPAAVRELGCDPDFNAYTLEKNPRPDGEVLFRTAAGHVHIGWGADIPVDNQEHMEICASFVKMMDATVGLFMTYIDREPRRRDLYGRAGAFRPKPYGVEYRTPSNVWIWNKDRRQVFHRLACLAVDRMTQGYSIEKVTTTTEEQIQRIINEGDADTAWSILNMMLIRPNTFPAWRNIVRDMEAKGL